MTYSKIFSLPPRVYHRYRPSLCHCFPAFDLQLSIDFLFSRRYLPCLSPSPSLSSSQFHSIVHFHPSISLSSLLSHSFHPLVSLPCGTFYVSLFLLPFIFLFQYRLCFSRCNLQTKSIRLIDPIHTVILPPPLIINHSIIQLHHHSMPNSLLLNLTMRTIESPMRRDLPLHTINSRRDPWRPRPIRYTVDYSIPIDRYPITVLLPAATVRQSHPQ